MAAADSAFLNALHSSRNLCFGSNVRRQTTIKQNTGFKKDTRVFFVKVLKFLNVFILVVLAALSISP